MKERTRQEIEAKARGIWPDAKIEISDCVTGGIWLSVSKMYEAPGLSFANLMELAEFFGTKAINDERRFNVSGCETCDYGSSYGFQLRIKPEEA